MVATCLAAEASQHPQTSASSSRKLLQASPDPASADLAPNATAINTTAPSPAPAPAPKVLGPKTSGGNPQVPPKQCTKLVGTDTRCPRAQEQSCCDDTHCIRLNDLQAVLSSPLSSLDFDQSEYSKVGYNAYAARRIFCSGVGYVACCPTGHMLWLRQRSRSHDRTAELQHRRRHVHDIMMFVKFDKTCLRFCSACSCCCLHCLTPA